MDPTDPSAARALPRLPAAQPEMTPQAQADRQARLEREAAALRANLRRRKDQVRAREAGRDPPKV